MQTEPGQNWLARQVTKKLSKDLQTHISIKHIKVGLFSFDKMDLEGLLVEDRNKDTLLYAGRFRVNITDWFFFKEKAELKYVGLEDAVVKLNRTDSVWNYAFLQSYFASSGSAKSEAGIQFDLKKVMLRNVSFIKKDAWIGNDLEASIGSLDMDARELNLNSRIIDIANLTIENPYVSILDYQGRYTAIDSAAALAKKKEAGWKIALGAVKISNGRLRNDKGDMIAKQSYFDGQHVDFSQINGSFKNIGWTQDTVTGTINLSARERSGLVIKSLKAKTTIHPKAMIFDDLYLQTNKSILGDYFAMRYDDISSMGDFLRAVTMEANFKKASISSDDIAFFAPDLRSWKKTIRIDGQIRGAVDALASDDLEVWAGSNTYLRGAVSLIGLPDITRTMINVDAKDLRTTSKDAVSFIPSIRSIQTPALDKLSYLRFKGSYTGFVNDFVTYGTLETNLGTLRTDLNMKFPAGGEPVYSGSFSTEGFQLGQFVNNPKLGILAFDGKVKGRGFEWKKLEMDIDGTIKKIQYANYTYQQIKAKGKLTNRLFNGDFTIKDPNADLTVKGLVDFSGSKPLFRVAADIGHANLQALQLTGQDLRLSGRFDLDLEASSLSDLLGTARITDASLVNNGKRLSFDSLIVTSSYVDGLKRLKAVSNEFDATITGDFDLQGLPDAFTLFLSRYYPSYIKAPRQVKPQIFSFDITTGVVEDYIKLIDSRLSGFNNSHLTGSLNTTANTMTIDANVPHFSFDQYDFSDIELKGSGDLEKLTLTGQAANAQIGDSLVFPQTTFSIQAQNDISDITVSTSSNQAINQANISARIQTFSDGASVLFNPSTFALNGKTWTIEQGGELNFRKNTIMQGQVVLRESNQEVRLWTQPSDVGNWNDLHVAWQNINLGDISPFITKKNRFEGIAAGEGIIEDPANKFNVTGKLQAEELRIDGDSIGRFDANVDYNNRTGMLVAKGNNGDPDHRIEVDVAMDLKDTANTFRDRINARLTNFELKYLNRFLGTIFSDIRGYVTGNLDILGEGSDRDFLAKARVRDASFKVNFTQVTYAIDDTEIELAKDRIDLGNIRIRDRFRNTALVNGYISHNGFANMYYDLEVKTESRQMELLNTSYNDNQQFFGKAMGSGSFVLVGPQSDMLMDINVKASETDSSYITLPPSRTRESGQANFMVERKYGREMTPQSTGISSNLTYDIRLAANPLVNVEVILDELTNDAIRGRGTGNLRITSGTFEPLSIQGRYGIDQGNYVFSFQSFLKKPFVLRPGANNYIEWTGDPYDATVQLEAIYTADQVSFAPLANTLFYNGLERQRDDVNVVARLSGNLFKPTFDFKLEFPSNRPIYNTPEFRLALQQIEKNQNELNKQVTYLIVFNSFAPFENSTAAGFNPFGEFTYNTISGLFFGEVNKQLNQVLSKILRNNSATLNFTGSLYNRNLVDPNARGLRLPNQGNVNVSLGLPLFNDRAQITIGGTLDVPLQGDFQQSIRLFPDVTLELMLNQSGSLKATFFYRQNLDFLAGVGSTIPRRYGTSISYGKEFDTLGELFGKKRKLRNRKPAPGSAATDSTGTQ
ncbi:MAG TPA: hypothetical protein VFR58_18680 [Flavisolibacter sp.]|nr:hypothetical protein [Flavisolibacter sp.]